VNVQTLNQIAAVAAGAATARALFIAGATTDDERKALAKTLVEAPATGVAGVASGILLANKASTDNVKALLALADAAANTQQVLARASEQATWQDFKAAVAVQVGNVLANQNTKALALLKAAIADGNGFVVPANLGKLLDLTLASLAAATNKVSMLATLLADATILQGINGALAANPANLAHKATAAVNLLTRVLENVQVSDADKQSFVTTVLSLPANAVAAAPAAGGITQGQANVEALLAQLAAPAAAAMRSLILQAASASQKTVADAVLAQFAPAVGVANASRAAVTLVSGAEKAADRVTLAKAMLSTLTEANGAAFADDLADALIALNNPATENGFNQIARVLAAVIENNTANAVALIDRAMASNVGGHDLVAVLPGADAAAKKRNLVAKVVEYVGSAHKEAVTRALYTAVQTALGQSNAVSTAVITAEAANLQALAIANRVAA
jgi:hypothetical protein